MNLFDNETTSESSLELPEYLQGLPPQLAGRLQELIGQDYLTPDQLVAPYSPAQQQAINEMIGFGDTQNVGDDLMAAGSEALAGMGMGQDVLQGIIDQGPRLNTGVDMDYVSSLIDNDVLQGQIDAALRDPTRQLTEQTLPGSRLASAFAGQSGSTRRGVGEAVAERGYLDRASDISGAMRGDAFRQALGLGGQQAAQNAQLGAMFDTLSAGIGSDLFSQGVQGANLMGMGRNINLGDIDAMMSGGGMETAYQQALLDAGREGFLFDYNAIPALAGTVGNMAGTYGTQVNTTTQSPSALSAALATVGTFMGVPGSPGASGGGGGNTYDPSGFSSAANFVQPGQVPIYIPNYGS